MTKKFIAAMWPFVFIVVVLVIFMALMPATAEFLYYPLLGIIALDVVLCAWTWINESKYYDAYFYDATAEFLKIRKGWITPREVTLPYGKLQDVYVDQDAFDRMFGLYDVHVSTATVMSGMEAHIDGVNHENSERIRELILSNIRGRQKI